MIEQAIEFVTSAALALAIGAIIGVTFAALVIATIDVIDLFG